VDPRVEARLQVGDQLPADAVAQEGRVGVRRVLAPGESALGQVSEHVQPGHLEQRPHHVARAGPHGGEASGPGASQQAEQERLGLVVPGVGHGDGRGPFLVPHRAQELIALAPGRVFETALLHPGAPLHVPPAEADGYPEALGEVGAEGCVRGALGPQAVVEVRGHDFKDPRLGHAIPYGVYDLGADEGWVSVGITRDTAQFAVNSILAWWEHLGQQRYPDARTLTITADSGGSNSPRTRLWRVELGRLADKTGLNIRVLHFPPGTSKWNKIEHRMFSFVSLNWRGKPLESLAVIVNLIAGTTTSTGLRIYARLDERVYEKGVEVTDHQLAAVNIIRDALHGDWNYAVTPSVASS